MPYLILSYLILFIPSLTRPASSSSSSSSSYPADFTTVFLLHFFTTVCLYILQLTQLTSSAAAYYYYYFYLINTLGLGLDCVDFVDFFRPFAFSPFFLSFSSFINLLHFCTSFLGNAWA